MIASFAAFGKKEGLRPHTYRPEELGPHDVEIEISHCGICHSDLHLIDDDWSRTTYPLVPGHEIVGTVSVAGPASGRAAGERVGVGWQRSACLECDLCIAGHENLCARQEAVCVGHHGGFAERIRTDGRFAFPLPASLESAVAAPLLCGGATVFAPLRRHGIGAKSSVGVIGIGGLGHLALRFLAAMGAEVTAFSSTPDKREEALRLGAHHATSSTDPRELRKLASSLDFLLCTAPARLDWIAYVQILRPNGILCLVGAPPGLIQIPASLLLTGQRSVCGSDIGSRAAIGEMLAFSATHGIGAQIETAPLAEVNGALDRLRRNEVRYRMVLVN